MAGFSRRHSGHSISPFSFIFTLLIVVLIALIGILSTPIGTQVLANVASAAVPGLSIKGVQGTLLTRLDIDNITFDDDVTRVEIKQLAIDPEDPPFRDNILFLHTLTVKELNVILTKSEDKNDKDYVPDIPILDLEAKQFKIDRLAIKEKNPDSQGIDEVIVFTGLGLVNAKVKEGWLKADQLSGTPIVAGGDMPIVINQPALQLDNPHAMSGQARLAYEQQEAGSLSANIALGGLLTAYKAKGDAVWKNEAIIPDQTPIKLDIQGDFKGVNLNNFEAITSQGDIRLLGRLDWKGGLAWNMQVDGKQVKAEHFNAEWPAVLDVKGKSQGSLVAGRPSLLIDIDRLQGHVRGRPIQAKGRVSYLNGVINTDELEAISEDSFVKVSGRATAPFDLVWDIDARNLSYFLPTMKGSIVGKGRVSGDLQQPDGSGNLRIDNLTYEDITLKKALINFDSGLSNSAQKGGGKMLVDNFVWRDTAIRSADIDLDLRRLATNNIVVKGAGKINGLRYQDIDAGEVDLVFDGQQQSERFSGTVKGSLANIDKQDIQLAKANIDVTGSFEQGQYKGQGRAEIMGLRQKDIAIAKADIEFTGGNDQGKLQAEGKGLLSGVSYQNSQVAKSDIVFRVDEPQQDIIKADVKGILTQVMHNEIKLAKADFDINAQMHKDKTQAQGRGHIIAHEVVYQDAKLAKANIKAEGNYNNGKGTGIADVMLEQVVYQDIKLGNIKAKGDGTYNNGDAEGTVTADLGQINYQGAGIQQASLVVRGKLVNGIGDGNITADVKQIIYQDAKIAEASIKGQGRYENGATKGIVNGILKQAVYQEAAIAGASFEAKGSVTQDIATGVIDATLQKIAYQDARIETSTIQANGTIANGGASGKVTGDLKQIIYQDAAVAQALVNAKGSVDNKGIARGTLNADLAQIAYQDARINQATIQAEGDVAKNAANGAVSAKLQQVKYQDAQVEQATIQGRGYFKDGLAKGVVDADLGDVRYQDANIKHAILKGKGSYANGQAEGDMDANLQQVIYQDATVKQARLKGKGRYINGRAEGDMTGDLQQVAYQGATIQQSNIQAKGNFANGKGQGEALINAQQATYQDASVKQSIIKGDGTFENGQFKGTVTADLKQASYQGAQAGQALVRVKGDFFDKKGNGNVEAIIKQVVYQDAKLAKAEITGKGRINNGIGDGNARVVFSQLKYQDININQGTTLIDARLNKQGRIDAKANGVLERVAYQDINVGRIKFEGEGAHLNGASQAKIKANLTATQKGDDNIALADLNIDMQHQPNSFTANGDFNAAGIKIDGNELSAGQGVFSVAQQNKGVVAAKGRLQLGSLKSTDANWKLALLEFEANPQTLKAKGNIEGLVVAGQPVENALFVLDGMPERHAFSLSADHRDGKLAVRAQGSLKQGEWKGTVQTLSLRDTVTGNWTLQKPVNLLVSSARFNGGEICLANPGNGSVCAIPDWSKTGGISLDARLSQVTMEQFNNFFPDSVVGLPGKVDGQTKFTIVNGKINGDLNLTLPESFVIVKLSGGRRDAFRYTNAKIQAVMKGDRIEATTTLDLIDKGRLTGQTTILLSMTDGKHRVNGDVEFNVASLTWAQNYFADINRLKGEVAGRVKVSGLVSEPQLSGLIEVRRAQFSIPDTGTRLSNINLTIRADTPKLATIQGSLNSGEGVLNINGKVDMNPLSEFRATMQLTGRDVQMMNSQEAKVWVSPELVFNASPEDLKVGGTLTISKASISLEELPELAIYESDDVVFVDSKTNKASALKKASKGYPVHPNVNIVLGNDIRFSGFGLSALLKGQFRVLSSKDDILAQGTVRLQNGVYKSYGQQLAIDNGVLVFNGPATNPGLNIRASRDITGEDLVVGMLLSGTLQKPKTTIFSEPTKSESDALSYLLTGHSLSATTGGEAQLLAHAVRSLGISGSNSLLARIGSTVGLDDVNIVTHDDYKKNQLSLGKRLGPNLYIRYIAGIFDDFREVAVNYQVNKRLKLEAVSGEEQALDFIYEMERD